MWDRTHFVIFYDDMMNLAGSNIILKICALGFAAEYFYFVSFLGIGFVWKIFEYISNRIKLHILSQVGMYTTSIFFYKFIWSKMVEFYFKFILWDSYTYIYWKDFCKV